MWKKYNPIVLLVIVVAAGYGAYMLYRYIQVASDLSKRSESIVRPEIGENDVSEIGYIYQMRNELFLKDDNTINLVWFVKIPATGEIYSCSWERGFSQFKTGDDVRLIRPKDLIKDGAGYGYIIGLHWELSGKTSLVWVVDNEYDELP